MSKLQMAIVAVCVLAAVCALIYFGTREAKAGGQAFWIPAPKGSRFEVNSKAQLHEQREGDRLVITLVSIEPERAKARWYYRGENCISVGDVDRVLLDIERCANRVMEAK